MQNHSSIRRVDSNDTLADVDLHFVEMRTCDGPCQDLMLTDTLLRFECGHAVCEDCLLEVRIVEAPLELCPVKYCPSPWSVDARLKSGAMQEYAQLKADAYKELGLPSPRYYSQPVECESVSLSFVPIDGLLESSPSSTSVDSINPDNALPVNASDFNNSLVQRLCALPCSTAHYSTSSDDVECLKDSCPTALGFDIAFDCTSPPKGYC